MSDIFASIRADIIGEGAPIRTPFGQKPLVYADYTASGRSLSSIEAFILDKVMPYYANTHTEASCTGRQTTVLREEARNIIRKAVNARERDRVIFCGSGASGAIHKLIDILNLRLPADLNQRYRLLERIPPDERPVVFIGPYEHHSNELPWRESIADLVVIPLTPDGLLDLAALEQQLIRHRNRTLKIGSFSAASNVTGLTTDVDAVAGLLHRYGAWSFWDYAAAAPYVRIDMQGRKNSTGDCSKDAVFISPHKFIGGPGTPGVLVVNGELLHNSVPAVPAGGTVVFVTPEDHRYIDDAERREEGGTPAIIESIRAGLVFRLQQQVGLEAIERSEKRFIRSAIERWRRTPEIEILGNPEAERLSIVSFQIRYGSHHLHYGLVVALLNDLFGIQVRGGCSCAGPYGHTLLGLDRERSRELEKQITEGHTVLRPGWVRLNFNYFIDEATFDYIVSAVELIARDGWRLLPHYQFNSDHGIWLYQGIQPQVAISLEDMAFGEISEPPFKERRAPDYQRLLADARSELRTARSGLKRFRIELPATARKLCWFVLPQSIEPTPQKQPA